MDSVKTTALTPVAPLAHAKLSASGSPRWLSCTASPRYEENFPDSTSPYAEEGTLAHELGEVLAGYRLGQISESDAQTKLATISISSYYNTDMLEYMQGYADFIYESSINTSTPEFSATTELEVRLDFSKWVPEGFGTGDCIIVSPGHLEIIDLKYGKGYQVSALNNSQMRLYALGAFIRYDLIYDIKTIKMTIYQPRMTDVPSFEEITVEELLRWAETEVVDKAKAAFEGRGVFAPSESNCKFCRGRKECGARTSGHQEFLQKYFDPEQIEHLTPNDAGFILAQAKDFKGWLTDLEKLVTSTLLSGEAVDGWKMVTGRSNRALKNTDEVQHALLEANVSFDDFMVQELVGIPKLEKLLGKTQFEELLGKYVVKPKGKPTLVPESDRRKALVFEAEMKALFDDGYQGTETEIQ